MSGGRPAAWQVRAARPDDVPALARLGADAPGAWDRATLDRERARPDATLWLAHAPDAAAVPLGVAAVRQAPGHAEVAWLAVAPGFRRRGIARRLMLAAIAAGRRAGAEALWLEVRARAHAARALYAALGLREVGARAGYYRDPDDDAVLLALPLSDTPPPRR